MTSYSVKTTAAEKVSLDLKIANLFYANNNAFNAPKILQTDCSCVADNCWYLILYIRIAMKPATNNYKIITFRLMYTFSSAYVQC
jgi:hypothetical protein